MRVTSSAASRVEWGHDRGEAAGQHRLADSGRTDEEQVVAARGRRRERDAARWRDRARRRGRGARRAVRRRRSCSGSGGSGHGASPFRQACSSPSDRATRTCTPGTSAASAAFAAGTMTQLGSRARDGVDERERARDRSHRTVEAELAEHADAVEHARGQSAVGAGERRARPRARARIRPCAPTRARG